MFAISEIINSSDNIYGRGVVKVMTFLHMIIFALNMTALVLDITAFVLNITVFVLNISLFFLYTTHSCFSTAVLFGEMCPFGPV